MDHIDSRFLYTKFLPRIHSSDFTIFTSKQNLRAVPVPTSRIDQIGQGEGNQAFTGTHVPNANIIIRARAKQNILGRGVPEDEADAALVLDQVHHGLGDGAGHPAVGDLPDFDGAVLGGRGYDVVVVGAPGDVQDGTFVTGDQGGVGSDPPRFA